MDRFRFDGSMLRFSFRPSTRSEPTIAVRFRFSSTPTTRIASRAIKVQKCKRKKMEKRENLQEENMLLDASTCLLVWFVVLHVSLVDYAITAKQPPTKLFSSC